MSLPTNIAKSPPVKTKHAGGIAKKNIAPSTLLRKKSDKDYFATPVVIKQNQSVFALAKSGLWDQSMGVRKGLPSAYVVEVSDALGMHRTNFFESLQLSRSTIEGRIKKNTPLTPAEGDAVLRAAKALTKAEEVFEDRAAASAWLKREIRSLGGVAPVSLMDTDSGFELVMNTLGRIEYGVVA